MRQPWRMVLLLCHALVSIPFSMHLDEDLCPCTCDFRNATNCSSGFLIVSSRDTWLLWIYLLLHQEPKDSVAFSITEREDAQQDPGRIITIIMVCPQLGATGLAFSPTCCWPALTHFIKACDPHCFSPSVTLPVTLLHLLILFSGGVNTSPTAGEQRQYKWHRECRSPANTVCVILKESHNFLTCR